MTFTPAARHATKFTFVCDDMNDCVDMPLHEAVEARGGFHLFSTSLINHSENSLQFVENTEY